jgi:TRAP transporter TAXI family solute receptor
MKKFLSIAASVLVALSLVGCGQSSDSGKKQDASSGKKAHSYTWGACSSSSGYYALNVAISDVINKNVKDTAITVMETGGGAQNLKFIKEGQVQFGQTSVPDIYLAANSLGSFKDTPKNDEVRLMLSLLPNVYYFVVSEDSGINSIADLKGKKFSPGNTNSSSERLAYAILGALGVEPEWYYASTSEAVDAMKNRRIDGYMKSGSSISMDSSIADVKTSVKVKVLSFTKDEIAKIKAKYPYYSFQDVDGSIFGQPGKITSMTSYYSFGVSRKVPEDVVYNIVKAICENQKYLEGSYAGLKGFDPAKITATSTTGYLHPGTIKYLKEKGYQIKKEQIPPDMK